MIARHRDTTAVVRLISWTYPFFFLMDCRYFDSSSMISALSCSENFNMEFQHRAVGLWQEFHLPGCFFNFDRMANYQCHALPIGRCAAYGPFLRSHQGNNVPNLSCRPRRASARSVVKNRLLDMRLEPLPAVSGLSSIVSFVSSPDQQEHVWLQVHRRSSLLTGCENESQ